MDASDFVSCIRKLEDAPEVREMLASVGVTTKLEVPPGESEARLSLTQLGLTLIFDRDDESSRRLTLTCVHFNSDAEEGYTSFAGALPNQLAFSDGPAEVHRKLGEPTRTKPKLRLDFWKSGDLQLSVNYTRSVPQRISMIAVEVPVVV